MILEIDRIMDKQSDQRFRKPVYILYLDTYLEEMAISAEPKNTLKRNKWTVNTFKAWAIRNNRHVEGEPVKIRSLDVMTSKDLYYWFSRFVFEVLKVDGTEYPLRFF